MFNIDDYIKTFWNEETGEAICILTSKTGEKFTASAICHPDDRDMMSEKTGTIIAQMRVSIKYFQHIKNHILRPQLQVLQHLESLYRKCDQNNYENKILRRQIRLIKNDLDITNKEIALLRQELKEYIDLKDKFYKDIRKRRGQKQLNNDKQISE